MTKPVNPNISVPQYFAQNGPKADFTAEKLESGFSKVDPDVLAGDNLNKFIDDTYKGLNYSTAGVEDLYKGLVTYDENETYTSKSVVVDFDEAGGLKLYRSLQDDNIGHPTSEADWWQEVSLGGSAGMPVGTIFAHTCAVDFVPENSLPCDGSEYTQSQFNDLYTDWLVGGRLNTCTYEEYQSDIDTYGKCAKFGLDSTSGKFKVPTIPNGTHIQQAMSDDELGKSYNAGLPNIEGSFHPSRPNNNALMKFGASSNSFVDGAFYLGNQANCSTAQETSNSWYGGDLCFDASRSNPIYSNNVETVQTEAVALRYFVVVATGAINESEMNWSEWATGLQGKLNTDHSNDTKPYVTETYENGTSWYRVWSDGWCEQGGYANFTETNTTVSLMKSYIDTNYSLIHSDYRSAYLSNWQANTVLISKTLNSFIIGSSYSNGDGIYWQAKGYIS